MDQNDLERISEAFMFAIAAHEGQERESGVPYISHPIRVALHALSIGLSTEAIMAAVLHDIVEDTDTSIETIVELFGEEIAEIVVAMTKSERGTPNRNMIYQEQLLQGPIVACQIKLLDIQDNLSSIDRFFSPEKAIKYRESRTQLAGILERRINQ
ncbi:MAG: HD domain-containing protein [Candidatus Thorarchaeota archaeon]